MSDILNDLTADLASDDPDTRRFAIEDLGDLADPRAIPALAPLLQERSAAIREAVVDALVGIGGVDAARAVIPLLGDETASARNAASEILQRIGAPARELLEARLADRDGDIRKYAVDILAEIASPDSRAALLTALDDENVNVAATAAEALGRIGAAGCERALRERAAGAAWMRAAVAKALGRIRTEAALNALREMLPEEEPLVAAALVEALARFSTPQSHALLKQLQSHAHPLVAHRAAAAVADGLPRNEESLA